MTTQPGTPTKAILYTRVSTGKQALSGLGLEAQLAKCAALAESRGYEVVDVQTDPALTGKDELGDRPGLQRVVEQAAKQPNTVVIVYSLSRLSRRQSLTWKLLDERGAFQLRVVSATEPFDVTTTMGRAMIGMLGIFNQLEADMCSERTSAALQAKKARGHKLGMPDLAATDPETVKTLQALHATGEYTWDALAAEANRRGLPTRRGGKWHATSVKRTVRQVVSEKPMLTEEEVAE